MQDLNDKSNGGSLSATEWNQVPSEIQNAIEETGQTLAGGDLNQLGKAMALYAGASDWYTDSGAADAYVLTKVGTKQAPAVLVDGLFVRFRPGNANTGASTVNVNGLGAVAIRRETDAVLSANDLVTTRDALLRYSASLGRFLLLNASFFVPGGVSLSKFASSSGSALPVGDGQVTEAHGLGGVPDFMHAYLVCTTTDQGYAVGDRVPLTSDQFGSIANGHGFCTAWMNATHVGISLEGSERYIGHKTGTGSVQITSASWEIRFVAFRAI